MREETEGPEILSGLEDLWNAFWALHKGRDWMVLTHGGAGATISMMVPKRLRSGDIRGEAEDRDYTGSAFLVFQTIMLRMDDVVHAHLTAEAGRAARRA